MRERPSTSEAAPLSSATSARCATDAGTSRFAARHAAELEADFFRESAARITLSSLGIGTYLGECTNAEDERYVNALREAMRTGINVLDTAGNYRCQRSERAVGAALAGAIAAGEVQRDEIVVCTKAGYLPLDGAPPVKRSDYEAYLEREFFASGVVSRDDVVGGGHSLAPRFLAYAIAQSKKNLRVETIDVFYLHNPEQQLASVTPEVLGARLREAFATLEEAASRGEIGWYGVATWAGLRVAAGARGHLSLADVVAAARDVAGDAHRLRYVQLPLNLAMPEAIRMATQSLSGERMVPPLTAASELGLTAVASASLMQGKLTHGLPPAVQELFPRARTDAERALAFVREAPGVTTALVGMRGEAHVRSNLAGFKRR